MGGRDDERQGSLKSMCCGMSGLGDGCLANGSRTVGGAVVLFRVWPGTVLGWRATRNGLGGRFDMGWDKATMDVVVAGR